ncbi:MAG: hypothetical protein V4548_01580 [Bacteroidota bacterium]
MKNRLTFTYVLEFRGGTYCTQVKSESVNKSVIVWIEKLKEEKKEIRYLADKTINEIELIVSHKDYIPVPLERLENIWFTHYKTRQGSLLVNIIQTHI